MLGRLDRAGYDAYVRIVNAWEYGVPQHRKRFILVGLRDGGGVCVACTRWDSNS
jgi:DNA (cytosine-5)-methyltransferase 1